MQLPWPLIATRSQVRRGRNRRRARAIHSRRSRERFGRVSNIEPLRCVASSSARVRAWRLRNVAQQQTAHDERVGEPAERARRAAGTRRDRSAACARRAAPRSGARAARPRTGRAASRRRSAWARPVARRARARSASTAAAAGACARAPRSRAAAGTSPRPRARAGPAARCARRCACRGGTRRPRRSARRSMQLRSIALGVAACQAGIVSEARVAADSARGRLARVPRSGCVRASPARG